MAASKNKRVLSSSEDEYENLDNNETKKMLKSFYAIYDLSDIQKEVQKEKNDGLLKGNTSLIDEYMKSNLVEQNAESPPIGGLRAKCYKSTQGLSYKTLMALNRWRHAQQNVLLPEPASIDDLDSGAESEIGIDLWNRRMGELLKSNKSKFKTKTRSFQLAIESSPSRRFSLDVKASCAKNSHGLELFSPGIDNLSFESVQSMPPYKVSKNNNSFGKQRGIFCGKNLETPKFTKRITCIYNDSEETDVFATPRTKQSTLVLKATPVNQHKIVDYPVTPTVQPEQNILRRSPRIQLLQSRRTKSLINDCNN